MRRVLSAIQFFPRGGSAHVARALARELPHHGWSVRLVSGSRRDLGPDADARRFYRGLELHSVDFTEALSADQPLRPSRPDSAPMHPSYEDRPDAPDRVFASLDDLDHERQVKAWADALGRAGARESDLLHLHHLTPLNEAAGRAAPSVPVVGQLHGTELLMLERIAAGPPDSWAHAERWARRLRSWATDCVRLLVAPGAVDRARTLLDVDRDRLVPLANGFDPEIFRPREVDRIAHWRRHLVEEPRGSAPGGEAGSLAYEERDLASFESGTVLLFIGRFTEVKRLPLLIRAHARASARFETPAPLVLVGGHPGEREGEHPVKLIQEVGAPDVFLAGWHDHDELPAFMAAADLVVLPSGREQFGQVLIEGMACGLPVIAASSYGANSIVDDGRTGWIVPPDDEEALAEALVEAVNDPEERRSRGEQAREEVAGRYSWSEIAARVASVFDAAVKERGDDAPSGEPLGR